MRLYSWIHCLPTSAHSVSESYISQAYFLSSGQVQQQEAQEAQEETEGRRDKARDFFSHLVALALGSMTLSSPLSLQPEEWWWFCANP